MHSQVYHSRDIQAWEQRWFAKQNSAFGLMQQMAWLCTQQILVHINQSSFIPKKIAVCCGLGNNAGDGYLVAKYLSEYLTETQIDIYEPNIKLAMPNLTVSYSHSYLQAKQQAQSKSVNISFYENFEFVTSYDLYIDALFGIGLNRELNSYWQSAIQQFNLQAGYKISIDIPSGLQANTGRALPIAVKADLTLTGLGLKAGLYTGQGKEYSGQIKLIELIPKDEDLYPIATLSSEKIRLPIRQAYGHKGSYGHVLVVGGHANMGGAVIMSAEAAFYSGAGKVSVVCDAKHHNAILSRAPNIMVHDINQLHGADIEKLIDEVDAVCFGMGLGRDDWASAQFERWFDVLTNSNKYTVLDADALWFLSSKDIQLTQHMYLTPHPGEAAKLLDCTVAEVEADRFQTIHALKKRYAGQWVLKGAGSLILDDQVWICTAGNAGMGTGGMGDVLAGMIASLKAQFKDEIALHQIVTLHAQAGDKLAEQGMRGIQAHHMPGAIYQVIQSI